MYMYNIWEKSDSHLNLNPEYYKTNNVANDVFCFIKTREEIYFPPPYLIKIRYVEKNRADLTQNESVRISLN